MILRMAIFIYVYGVREKARERYGRHDLSMQHTHKCSHTHTHIHIHRDIWILAHTHTHAHT